VSRYDIYWHKGSDPVLHNITVGGDVTSVRVNSLIPGLTYLFSIQCHDAAGRASNWAMEVPVTISLDVDPPAIPTGLTATSSATGIYLTWTEVGTEGISKDLKQYQIAISTDGGSTYPTIQTVGPGNSYYFASTIGGSGTVFFKVAAVDWTLNTSAYSSAVSASLGTLVGPITINPGPLKITGSSAAGELQLTSGNAGGADTVAQIAFGYSGSSPNVQYQSWFATQHNGGVLSGNTIQLYTGDGTANGVFPTNAVLGLTIDSSAGVTIAKTLQSTGVITAGNGINFSLSNTGVVTPSIHGVPTFGDIIIAPGSGNFVYFRPNDSTVNQSYITNTGAMVLANGLTATTGTFSGNVQTSGGKIIAGADPGAGGGGDIVANRGGASPGTGALFFGSSGGSHYLYYDGSKFNLTDGLAISGALTGATTGAFSGRVSVLGLDPSSSGSGASAAINFGAANPYLNASSYIVIPGGVYLTATSYIDGDLHIRNGLHYYTSGAETSGYTMSLLQSGLQTLQWPAIIQTETLAIKPSFTQTDPADPTGTPNGGATMMGMAVSFTPKVTGRVMIIATGNMANNGAGNGASLTGSYGTGTAPTNGAAFTGTAFGRNRQITATNAGAKHPFTASGIITGLTVNTAYWFDLALWVLTAGVANIFENRFEIMEI
jgi:hypothetical protein